ncbi:MAG: quinone-dependent dihydroorotate dehydrogenase [Arachidicoccus sp.]|nr:quinone-dependent dihydroorotate dehydrogenase [Arachidicoccus sp.]
MIYSLLRKALFTMPPEKAHYFSMNALKKICNTALGKEMIEKTFNYQHQSLHTTTFGLTFRNMIGLAAGFDKNALYLQEIKSLGFGFTEIGTVTPLPQSGNEQPRLFRLPADKALINRMGFNNEGAEAVRRRLEQWKEKNPDDNFIIGGNIGKNKITENELAWKDYAICFEKLYEAVDYFTVNVSSPNTPGLRALQDKDSLRKIFSELQHINQSKAKQKPILLKIAPDLSQGQLDEIIELSDEINLSGIIAANTTISRDNLVTDKKTIEKIGAGGLSGKPLQQISTNVLKYISSNISSNIPVIASGGIFAIEDVEGKIQAGAQLVQLWTGFIYEGPGIAGKLCRQLVSKKQEI